MGPGAGYGTRTTIAKNLNIYSKSGKPHAQLVGAVISTLELLPGESAETPYSRNGHDGVSTQYATSVQTKVWQWFEAAHWPAALDIKGRHYNIVYTEPGGATKSFISIFILYFLLFFHPRLRQQAGAFYLCGYMV